MKILPGKLFPLVIALFVIILYGNTLFNDYSFDDKLITAVNPVVQKGIGGIPEIFSSNYFSDFGDHFEYRPLAKVSFALEYGLFGKNTLVSHLVNLLLYVGTCLLLYFITLQLFNPGEKIFAFTAILLFLVHPTHTEAVASLKNREELMAFLFCLATVYFYLKAVTRQPVYYPLIAVFFFVAALFTKLTALPFILIVPLCIYYSSGKLKSALLPALVLCSVASLFLLGVMYFLPGTYHREVYFIENPIAAENSLWIILLNSLQTAWIYFKLYVFPHPLAFYYGYDVIPVAKAINPEIILSLFVLGLMIIYALKLIREKHAIAFGILFYLLNMSMYYNLVFPAPGIIADRALYVSSYGLSLMIAYGLMRFIPQKKIAYVLMPLLFLQSYKTIARNREWKDSVSLMAADIGHLKKSAKANMEYASVLREKYEEENDSTVKAQYARDAILYFREALKVKPDMAIPYNEMGEIQFNYYHQYKEARENFLKAVELLPSRPEYHFNLATSFAYLSELDKAEQSFEKVIELDPDHTRAMHNLFLVYMSLKKHKEAFRINAVYLDKSPGAAFPYFNFGKYYLTLGDTVKSTENFEKALTLDPQSREIKNILENISGRRIE